MGAWLNLVRGRGVLNGAVSALVVGVGMAGCSSGAGQAVVPPVGALVATEVEDPAFAAAGKILSGIEVAPGTEDWQIGDQVLLGIRVRKPGQETVRLLHLELTDKLNPLPVVRFKATPRGRETYTFESSVYYTRLTMYDGDGKLMQTALGRFPEKLMGRGLFDGAEPSIGRVRSEDGTTDYSKLPDEQAERELLGWLSLFSFSMSMNKKGMFNEMMKDVVARPSLLAMLLNPSVTLGMGDGGEVTRQAWTPIAGVMVDAVTVPLVCTIADKDGAVARVHAAKPVAPLGLSGGVVSIVGNNAQKPEITFEVRLLAAKRGTGGKAFRPEMEE